MPDFCRHGHEYTPDNVVIHGGHRVCRTCRKRQLRDSQQKAKEARRGRKVEILAHATPRNLSNYTIIPETGCWLWLGNWLADRYGSISSDGLGAVPAHLFLGTHTDNCHDKIRKGRNRRGAGHPKIVTKRELQHG